MSQKTKPKRSLQSVGESQRMTEQTTKSKFDDTKQLAHGEKSIIPSSQGRVSPQISCTVLPEDKQMLNDITMFAINKAGKPLNTSSIIRALIRLGHERREELEF